MKVELDLTPKTLGMGAAALLGGGALYYYLNRPQTDEGCAEAAVRYLRRKCPSLESNPPQVAIVCGSGLGEIADLVEDAVSFPYSQIPGFPCGSVKGHSSELVIGTLKGVPVAVLKGRVHLYEGIDPKQTRVLIYTLRLLGASQLILSSAVGSCRKEVGPGSICLLTDHINNQWKNPLCGHNDPIGPRFVGMREAYDKKLRANMRNAAESVGVTLHDAIYWSNLGPTFETPAEVRMSIACGADVLGMSTVGETICARHCGLRVVALSIVTNYACALDVLEPNHQETMEQAGLATPKATKVICAYMESIKSSLVGA